MGPILSLDTVFSGVICGLSEMGCSFLVTIPWSHALHVILMVCGILSLDISGKVPIFLCCGGSRWAHGLIPNAMHIWYVLLKAVLCRAV